MHRKSYLNFNQTGTGCVMVFFIPYMVKQTEIYKILLRWNLYNHGVLQHQN